MNKKIKDFPALIGSVSFGIASWGSAFIFVAQNDWFGSGDLSGFAFLVVLFSALTYPLLHFLHKKTTDKSLLISYGSALLTSIILTIFFILLLVLLLGPWIGAFSFPVLFCLLIGSSIASILTVYIGRPTTWFPAVISSLILPVTFYLLVSVFLAEPNQLRVTFSEQITYEELSTFTDSVTKIDGVNGFRRVDGNGETRIQIWFDSGLSDRKRSEIVSEFESKSFIIKLTDIEGE
ncbi:hypothetical protein [Rhodohalobacter sp. 8-1]|uniref:hypothetical protein n=1 Tax=Rhodohalobacter sp. 8-1 TaxID=3131972 RepID=UPI0030ECA1F0